MASMGMIMHEPRRSPADLFRPRSPAARVVCGGCGLHLHPRTFQLGPWGLPMCARCLGPLVAPVRRTRRARRATRGRAKSAR